MIIWIITLAIVLAALHTRDTVVYGIFFIGLLFYLGQALHAKKISLSLVVLTLIPLGISWVHLPREYTLPGLTQLIVMMLGVFLFSCLLAGVRMVKMRAIKGKKKK